MPFENVIQRATANVRERLAAEPVDELVYAVSLMASDEDLCAYVIAIGLERDRAAMVASLNQFDAFRLVWNAYEFALEAPREPILNRDAEFRAVAAHEREAVASDRREVLYDPRTYVLNRVAANVGTDHPLRSVTDDFVVYAWPDSLGDELIANLKFSASADAAQLLRARDLLPEDSRCSRASRARAMTSPT